LDVLVWNYHDDDVAAPAAAIQLAIRGIPERARRVLLRHYRIDRNHSNAYSAWKKMGSPQSPTSEQYAKLERAGQLQLFKSPRWLSNEKGEVKVSFALPRQGVSLVEMIW
jgi:xylan 1,4-beta-xylosidase